MGFIRFRIGKNVIKIPKKKKKKKEKKAREYYQFKRNIWD